MAGGSTVPRPREAGRFLLPGGFPAWPGLAEAGCANTVTWGFPVTVVLVAVAWREFLACLLRAPGVPLPPGEVERVQGSADGCVGRCGERVQ